MYKRQLYGRILLAGMAAFMLQTTFQSFFIVAERPHMGLVLSLAAGVTNMVLDYVFIRVFGMGVAGAALATILGYVDVYKRQIKSGFGKFPKPFLG